MKVLSCSKATAGSVHRSPGDEFKKKYVFQCLPSDLVTWGTQFILVSFMDDGCSNRCLLEVFNLPSMNLFYVTEKNCSWSKQIMGISKRWCEHRHLSSTHRSSLSFLSETNIFRWLKTETLSAWLPQKLTLSQLLSCPINPVFYG